MTKPRPVPPAVSSGATRIVLYDGVCGFCDSMVGWLIEHDGGRFHYALGDDDRARLRQGVAAAARCYLAAGAEEVYLPLLDHAPLVDEDAIDAVLPAQLSTVQMASLYAVHLFGGAAMGRTPERAVCDARGAVFGAKGLYVVDGSALPTNTGVNPQITILANALRIAAGIAA